MLLSVAPTSLLAHEAPEVAPNRQRALEPSMRASQPLVECEAAEAEEAEAAEDFGEEEQLDMGQTQSEAAARLAEDEAHAAESVRAAVVVGQEEEDTAVRRGAPGLDAGAADAASVDQSKGFRRRGLPARILASEALARRTKTS